MFWHCCAGISTIRPTSGRKRRSVVLQVGVQEVHDVLNPHCERNVPELWH
jgi:hypothetical protein